MEQNKDTWFDSEVQALLRVYATGEMQINLMLPYQLPVSLHHFSVPIGGANATTKKPFKVCSSQRSPHSEQFL